VGFIGTKKLIIPGFNQRNKGLFSSINQPTVDTLKVGDKWKVLQGIPSVDCLEPLHLTVTDNWVSSQEKHGFLEVERREKDGRFLYTL
jgi:hypothetical protein